jgi:tetratricopeptide (TPR) repeat protein
MSAMQELESADRAELTKLVNAVALSDRSLSLFAIAPDSAPNHPVVEQFKAQLRELDEPFQFHNLYYSDDSLFDFLHRLDKEEASGRPVVMAFGLESLPRYRLQQEMQQLNLGRERIFDRNIILVFWLNRETFLNEFRQQAADFWDWRGNVAVFATRPPSNPLLYPYLEWLIADNSYLKMAGVMQVNRQVDILLDRIYVSLQAEWVEERSRSFRERVTRGEGRVKPNRGNKLGEPDFPDIEFDEPMLAMSAEPTSSQRVTKIVDLAEGLRKHTYSAILGDPGAGKTTLLRYLARHFAIAYRGIQAVEDLTSQPSQEESPSPLRVGEGSPKRVLGGMGEDLGEIRLPVLFRIADFAERLAQQPDLSLVEYLKQFYRQWESDRNPINGCAVADLLLNKMAVGDCLVLMDGLDEVFDRANRVQVVEQIDLFVKEYSENKFAITSRIAGYQEASLGSRFRELTIAPMGNAEIKKFLERWCFAIEEAQRPEADVSSHQRDAEREAQGILRAIETKPGVKRFAANPLLLTILALIHRNGTQMPQRRVELYQLATKTLIEDWQFGRNIAYGVQQGQLSLVEEEVTALLSPLAFQMHEEKPSGLVTQGEVEAWLTPRMADLQGVEEPEAVELVRQFLRKVRETTGLFVERAPAVYGFMHLTFEEYYAARYIADNEIPDILKIINTYRYQARWNEPLLLALGYLSADRQRVNRLLEQLFGNLADYQPDIAGKEMRLKEAGANRVLVWYSLEDSAPQESDLLWQDLLFVGQVLAEIKVTPKFCRQQVEKLVLTYLGLDLNYNDEPTQELLRLLRGIELFNQQVLDRLKQAAADDRLSEEQQNKARVAMLYVVCGEAGESLIAGVTGIIKQLTPSLFEAILNLVSNLGVEMTPNLERELEDGIRDPDRRQALEFMTGLSYLRSENYDRAISLLQTLEERVDCDLGGFIEWAIAFACEKKEDYDRALNYYQQCSDKLLSSSSAADLFILWRYWGICYRSHQKYDLSLNCFQEALGIARQFNKRKKEANILWNIGRSYQDWEKYEEAIAHHQQSRELYQQLDKQINVANQWYWIGNCYKAQGKYEQAIEFQQRCLNLRRLEDDGRVALSFSQLGQIYQDWGKYEEAIDHHQQSREIYQQLGKQTNVANQWYWMAVCYRQWGKYQQALDASQQDLALRQQLDDRPNIADAYYQLGRIYQDWGKYQEAIDHHQQSQELYQQLGKQKDVANLWYWIGDCYKDWCKYEQAIECQQQCLNLRQLEEDRSRVAISLYQLGQIYQDWGKYEEAIDHYQQSRELYQQLSKEKNVAGQWYNLADCYRQWGKYEQSLDAIQQCLALRQQLDDRPSIANTYFQLGWIYQDWEKYEEAIAHYQQSRELYQQLSKEKNVASQWSNLADCYRQWGKYEQSLDAIQQCLALRQQLDDRPGIAIAYYQLGRIYQDWGKYQEAIDHHQQSQELYQQLNKQKDVANLWYWMAVCYRQWGKYSQALDAQQQCLALRQQLDDRPSIAIAYYQLGRIYQDWGKYQEAIDYYQQSQELYQQLSKQKDVANQWYWIGDCYKDWCNYEQAIECQQQCLNLRQLEDDRPRIALAYYQLGGIYQDWGKYQEAIDHHQQSQELYQQLGKQKDVANLWYWIGDCYKDWCKYEQAIECQQQCLNLRQLEEDRSRVAISLYQLGQIYQDWGKYEEAIDHYQQSRELYQQLSKEKNVASQWSNLAVCYRQWGKYEQSLDAIQQCLALRQQLDDRPSIATTYFQLGWIYQDWEKYEEAIDHYQQSQELYQQLSKEKDVSSLWYWIADCYRQWGKYQQAFDASQQDLALRQQLDDRPGIASAYLQLGRIYQDWGKYQEAIAHHQQSQEIYHQLDKQKDVANLWYWMAVCYRQWGKYQQAFDASQQDLALRQQLDFRLGIAGTYYQLGRIYQDWKKYEEAIAHYQQSREIYQQLDQTESLTRQLRRIANSQRLLARETVDRTAAISLLTQAEKHLQQAIKLNIDREYRENLAYDYIALSLVCSEFLRHLPADDATQPSRIAQFENTYPMGFGHFTALGKTVNLAEETLDIARAYLEIPALENLDFAESLTRQSLQTFQEFNRRRLQADALKLLGEIYKHRLPHQPATVAQFFLESRQIYQQLDLTERAIEIDKDLLNDKHTQ